MANLGCLENSLPSMFKMNAGYFLVQIASETDKEKVCRSQSKCSYKL